MSDPIETFAANLSHAIATGKPAQIGRGTFGRDELRPVLAILKAAPAMLDLVGESASAPYWDDEDALTAWVIRHSEKAQNLLDRLGVAQGSTLVQPAAAEGATNAPPVPDPRDALIAQMLDALNMVWVDDDGDGYVDACNVNAVLEAAAAGNRARIAAIAAADAREG